MAFFPPRFRLHNLLNDSQIRSNVKKALNLYCLLNFFDRIEEFFLNLTAMKLTKKNISYFLSIVLIASFTISFSHTVIEQLGSTCANHDDHDFSKVIVNVVLPG